MISIGLPKKRFCACNQEIKFTQLKEYNESLCFPSFDLRVFRAQICLFQSCQLKKTPNASTSQVFVDEWGRWRMISFSLPSTILLMKPRFKGRTCKRSARAQHGLIKTCLLFGKCVFFVFGANIHSDNEEHGLRHAAVSIVVNVVNRTNKREMEFECIHQYPSYMKRRFVLSRFWKFVRLCKSI